MHTESRQSLVSACSLISLVPSIIMIPSLLFKIASPISQRGTAVVTGCALELRPALSCTIIRLVLPRPIKLGLKLSTYGPRASVSMEFGRLRIHHAMDMDMNMDRSDILRDKVVLTYVTPPSPRGDFFLTDRIQSNVRGDA